MNFEIGNKKVGAGEHVFIVAEVAQAHDGSLGTAHAFIDAAAECGVDAIKFQTHIASAESTAREPFRVKFSLQDATRYDYWKRMEFTAEQWRGLAKHAKQKKLVFLSSPFSVEAVDMLVKIGMPAWKIGSGEVSNTVLLDRIIKTRKPVLLSSGMSSGKELDHSVARLRRAGSDFMIYQCTSKYPCPPEDIGLSLIPVMARKYRVPIGLSDHSGVPYAGIAAAAIGAVSVEVHITMSRKSFGPDVCASLVPDELRTMVEGIRFVEKSMSAAYSKDRIAARMDDMKNMFGRSIVAKRNIKAGERMSEENITVKKPGGGISPEKFDALIGKKIKNGKSKDDLIRTKDIE